MDNQDGDDDYAITLETLQKKHDSLKKKFRELTSDHRKLNGDYRKVMQSRVDLETRLTDAMHRNVELQNAVTDLTAKLAAAPAPVQAPVPCQMCATKDVQIAALEKEGTELATKHSKCNRLAMHAQDLETQLAKAQQEIDEFVQSEASIKARTDALFDARLKKSREEIFKLGMEKADLVKKMDEANTAMQRADEAAARTTREFVAFRRSHENCRVVAEDSMVIGANEWSETRDNLEQVLEANEALLVANRELLEANRMQGDFLMDISAKLSGPEHITEVQHDGLLRASEIRTAKYDRKSDFPYTTFLNNLGVYWPSVFVLEQGQKVFAHFRAAFPENENFDLLCLLNALRVRNEREAVGSSWIANMNLRWLMKRRAQRVHDERMEEVNSKAAQLDFHDREPPSHTAQLNLRAKEQLRFSPAPSPHAPPRRGPNSMDFEMGSDTYDRRAVPGTATFAPQGLPQQQWQPAAPPAPSAGFSFGSFSSAPATPPRVLSFGSASVSPSTPPRSVQGPPAPSSSSRRMDWWPSKGKRIRPTLIRGDLVLPQNHNPAIVTITQRPRPDQIIQYKLRAIAGRRTHDREKVALTNIGIFSSSLFEVTSSGPKQYYRYYEQGPLINELTTFGDIALLNMTSNSTFGDEKLVKKTAFIVTVLSQYDEYFPGFRSMQITKESKVADFVGEVFPKYVKFVRWFYNVPEFDMTADGLARIMHEGKERDKVATTKLKDMRLILLLPQSCMRSEDDINLETNYQWPPRCEIVCADLGILTS
jgi:hypothetical protein